MSYASIKGTGAASTYIITVKHCLDEGKRKFVIPAIKFPALPESWFKLLTLVSCNSGWNSSSESKFIYLVIQVLVPCYYMTVLTKAKPLNSVNSLACWRLAKLIKTWKPLKINFPWEITSFNTQIPFFFMWFVAWIRKLLKKLCAGRSFLINRSLNVLYEHLWTVASARRYAGSDKKVAYRGSDLRECICLKTR